MPNSTFTLGGQIYAYVEDAQHNLLAITGTKLYPIAQPALTFKLDSSLVFTISTTRPRPPVTTPARSSRSGPSRLARPAR